MKLPYFSSITGEYQQFHMVQVDDDLSQVHFFKVLINKRIDYLHENVIEYTLRY